MKRILIANRGEIARRVIQTAHRMGIDTVAVYSDPDANALHVREATQAVALGGAASADTYLRTEHVVWQPEMLGLARVAAAVNQSGLKYQANSAVFQAVYEQKINLADTATFKQWAAQQKSFDGQKLIAAYDSFSNQAQAKKMEELTNTYQISGTPTVIVGGKYQVKFTGDWNAGMKTIDELAAKVRSERGMKAPAAKPAAAALKSKGAALAKTANK